MSPIRCFLVAETGRAQIYLRRYLGESECATHGYHNALVVIDVQDATYDSEGYLESLPKPPKDDPRWPTHCDCGYEFGESGEWQIGQKKLYDLAPDVEGNEAPCPGPWPQSEFPVGAMFYPSWLQGHSEISSYICPTEGSVLCVIIPANPDGTGRTEWIIDAYCSNCDKKGQKHHCWCRRGSPPNVTVDKNPPDELGTCNAGSGSIWSRMPEGWHGFLRNGYLENA